MIDRIELEAHYRFYHHFYLDYLVASQRHIILYFVHYATTNLKFLCLILQWYPIFKKK